LGIIDEMAIVEKINKMLLTDSREKVNTGEIVKAILLMIGFVWRPLYLFPQEIETQGIEHLLGGRIGGKILNDDKIGRVMDKLSKYRLTKLFLITPLGVVKNME
jgi:transposase